MNRLLTRRRGKDGGDILSRGKKGKKAAAAKQPELDLNTILPSTENFRTSLLLPNLSARFSMLREQDDPTSLLGKASDDSVLHPKRASRLPEFGYASGLSDIAEVSSFSSLVKPPFADQRVGSMASTDGSITDDGSGGNVMNRSRTREGNNLFGGRQKTFKVSVSASDDSAAKGKISFENDTALSTSYHRPGSKSNATEEEKIHTIEEKGLPKEDTLPEDAALALLKFDDDGSTEFSNSPSSEYQGKRATSSTSSLNSTGPSYTRASTAATSVASQGANSIPPSPAFGAVAAQAVTSASGISEKSMTRSKRLYEQSLDQHYHEQQNSALNRLNSFQKQRSASTKALPSLGQPKFGNGERSISATALDRPSRATPLPPPPMAKLPELNTFDIGNNQANKKINLLPASNAQSVVPPLTSPISPFTDFHENRILTSSLEPSDRGKATALGAFNKPRPFDEQQYLERQKQMQQRIESSSCAEKGRVEPVSPVAHAEPINGSPKFSAINPQSAVLPLTSPTIPTFSMAPYKTHSTHSGTSNTLALDQDVNSVEERDSTQPKPNDLRTDEVPLENQTSKRLSTGKQHQTQAEADKGNVGQASLDPATDENTRNVKQSSASSVQAPETSWAEEISPSPKSHLQRFEADRAADIQPVVDSPTLGPGLSGLVKQHLRNVSNVSSVYSVATAAGMAAVDSSYPMPALDDVKFDIPLHSTNDRSNTWNNDDCEVKYSCEPDGDSPTSVKGKVDAVDKDQSDTSNELSSDVKLPRLSTETTQQLKDEVKKKHNRDGSTETQHERKAFANELIHRQRQIQENLRNKTQCSNEDSKKDRAPNRSESRSGSRIDSKVLEHNSTHSPALGMSAPFKAWSAIKSVGRDSASSTTKEVTSLKAIKSFGSDGSSSNFNSTFLASMDEQREIQQPDSRKPSASDGVTMKLSSLSESRRPSDLQAIDDGKARHHRIPEHTLPYRPRGRLPRSNDTNEQQEWSNQRRRGQSEGPRAPRTRRPTMIKAESDQRDRAFSESGPAGFPQRRNEDPDLNGKFFNRKGSQKPVSKTAPLPSKAVFPFAKSPAPNNFNHKTVNGHSSASDTNRAIGRPPRNTRTGVQPGLGSQKNDPNLVQPNTEGPSQGDTNFSATSVAKSPLTSPNASTALRLPPMRTVGLPPDSKIGANFISPIPNPSGKLDDPSSSPVSPAAQGTTTPLSMTIKSGNATPTSHSASASPSTAALVPPDLPAVPIRLGSGGPPRKRHVNKIEISDPTFVSSTSTVETVTLEIAKQNQSEFPSSIPEISTGRRHPKPFAGAVALSAPQSPLNGQLSPGEQFKGNDRFASTPVKPMKRLRHVLSEGHGLYGKARQQQQKQQRQTIQTQHSGHITTEATANKRAMMPAAIAVTENGMF